MPISSFSMVTRSPPSTPCRTTAPSAITPRLRNQFQDSLRQTHCSISEKENPLVAGFRARVCGRRLVSDARPALFSHQHSASHGEAATAEDPATLLAELGCSLASPADFPFSARLLEVRPAIQLA